MKGLRYVRHAPVAAAPDTYVLRGPYLFWKWSTAVAERIRLASLAAEHHPHGALWLSWSDTQPTARLLSLCAPMKVGDERCGWFRLDPACDAI